MSYQDYMDYKNSKRAPSKFVLEVPNGLSKKDALIIISHISSLFSGTKLPIDKEFNSKENNEKRAIISNIFDNNKNALPFAEDIFQKYIINANFIPNFPNSPLIKNVPKDRLSPFNKGRNFLETFYNYRFNNNSGLTFKEAQRLSVPFVYNDNNIDWFKKLQTIPKTQLYYSDEAKDIKEIIQEYKNELIDSSFTKIFKDKLFFFPIEAVDEDGNYYTFIKQIEITKNKKTKEYMTSLSVSVIPKNNPKFVHQIMRIDSDGYHANSCEKKLQIDGKENVFEIREKNINENEITTLPKNTYGIHMHLFSNKCSLIYLKNPSTADAVGIENIINMWQDLDYFKNSDLHPCLRNLIENKNQQDVYSKLFDLWVINANIKKDNFSTYYVRDILDERNIKLNECQIVNNSKFLYMLDMIQYMDDIANYALNISPNPVPFFDKEYVENLRKSCEHKQISSDEKPVEFKSQKNSFDSKESNSKTKRNNKEKSKAQIKREIKDSLLDVDDDDDIM